MKIDFTMSNGTYSFSDALHLPDDHAYTDEQIEAMKQQRFDNWLAIIIGPSTEEIPIIEQGTTE